MNKNGMFGATANTLDRILTKIPLTYNGIMKRMIGEDFKTLLDVGTGTGLAIQLVNPDNKFQVTGIEIYKPYIEECRKKGLYENIIEADIRTVNIPEKSYDTVICLHVIEHLNKDEGWKMIEKLEGIALKSVILAMPIGHFEQNAYDDNEHQEHKSEWYPGELQQRGYKVIGQGLKVMYGENNVVKKYGTLVAYIFFCISTLLEPLLFIRPEWGVYMFGRKNIS
jgi:hypothetical protein